MAIPMRSRQTKSPLMTQMYRLPISCGKLGIDEPHRRTSSRQSSYRYLDISFRLAPLGSRLTCHRCRNHGGEARVWRCRAEGDHCRECDEEFESATKDVQQTLDACIKALAFFTERP